MPKKTSEELSSVTCRVPIDTAGWLNDLSLKSGLSVSSLIRAILDDAQSYYGLPSGIVAVLEADRKKSQAATQRDYVLNLLTSRYTELVTGVAAPLDARRAR